MRIIVDEDRVEGILDGTVTTFVVPTSTNQTGSAQARSFGYGVKDYYALEWQTDEGLQWIHKGERYEFTTGVRQPTLGTLFIQGIDKDDFFTDRHIRRLGFLQEDSEEAKEACVKWWNARYPNNQFHSSMRYWQVNFALVKDPDQEIPTDTFEVYEIRIDEEMLKKKEDQADSDDNASESL
jgi:hypothetical protein